MINEASIKAAIASVVSNWKMWLCYLCAVAVVARDNLFTGTCTFFGLISAAYFVHRFSHLHRNFFTLLHHYHHENDNWLAYFSQILIEILFGVFVLPFSYAGYTAHPWVTMLFVLVYSSVHNVNYGICKVNQVHARHHKNVHQNVGPDVCDILFQSKHGEPEDTSHYIPNIVIALIAVVLAQRYDVLKEWHLKAIAGIGVLAYLAASLYVSQQGGSTKKKSVKVRASGFNKTATSPHKRQLKFFS
jgi:hypothetical protein